MTENSDSQSSRTYVNINPVVTKPSSDLQYIQPIMLQPGYDTETGIYGLGYSPDNGVHFYVTYTTFGCKYRQEDADRLWKYLQGFVSKQIHDAVSLTWDDIKGKPDLALKSDLPDFNQFALKKNLPVVPTDLVHTAEMEQVKETANQAAQTASEAVTLAKSASVTIDTSNIHQIKRPSEYSEGFSYEVKNVNEIGLDRTNFHVSVQQGTQGLLTTVSLQGFARQKLEILDSDRPLTFERNGAGDTWHSWAFMTTA